MTMVMIPSKNQKASDDYFEALEKEMRSELIKLDSTLTANNFIKCDLSMENWNVIEIANILNKQL